MMGFGVMEMVGPVKRFLAGGVSRTLWEDGVDVNGASRSVLKASAALHYGQD